MKQSKAVIEQTARVMDTLYSKGPLSRIDLSKLLSITPATVSDITQHLIINGLIKEIGEDIDQNKVGRRKILLGILPDHSYYVGVELFEHTITLCLSDNRNTVIDQTTRDLNKKTELSNTLIINTVQEFIEKNRDYQISAIGIALPGHYDLEVETIITNNPYWSRISLLELKSGFSIPVHFENNVNCMAINERLFGSRYDEPNFLYLHFRKGIFCTYVYQGEIYARNNFFVGEMGHMVVNPNGEQCECGKKGCLQTYISQTWLIKKARALYSNPETSYIHGLVNSKEEITMKTILQAYSLGDVAVLHMMRTAIDYLSIIINNVIVTLDTDIIYIHSELFDNDGLSNQLLERIEENDSEFIQRKQIDKKIMKYTKQHGAHSACALAIEQTITKVQ